MYIVANLAVGEGWSVPPDRWTPFLGDLQIDYIRAWQR